MNTIIVTYAALFVVVRFYAGADADVSMTLVANQLQAAGYSLTESFANVVLGNTARAFHVWTRAVAGDPFEPEAVPNVTWQAVI